LVQPNYFENVYLKLYESNFYTKSFSSVVFSVSGSEVMAIKTSLGTEIFLAIIFEPETLESITRSQKMWILA